MYLCSALVLELHPCPPIQKRRFAKTQFRSPCFFLSVIFSLIFLVCRPAAADTIKIGGTGASMGALRALAGAFKKSHPVKDFVFVYGLGSAGARDALLARAIDVAVTSQPGNRPENMPDATIIKYGQSPFIFATSKSNSASGLTDEEVLAIYSGKVTAWPNGKRLRVILRPDTDSDTVVLKSISPAMEQAVKTALRREGMKLAITDQDSADAIEGTPGAIGTSTLGLILSEKRSLKALALNGLAPSARSLGDRLYPYFKTFYMIAKSPLPEGARQFILFVRSRAGREILARLGHWIPETENGLK
jgi:phosphate transport system substrate-binding protein